MSGAEDPPASRGGERAQAEDLLEEALGDLRQEIRERMHVHGAGSGDPAGSEPGWMELAQELRDRMRSLGMHDRSGETDDFGFDPDLVRSTRPLFDFLRERWWRIEVSGTERLPRVPALLVANRAGLLPWDGLMIAHVMEGAIGERPRFLAADWLITLPFAQPLAARLGGVRACPENAARLLASGRSVVAFPEGLKGAAKVFRERYRLQRFGRGGVVRLALEARVPLVPVAVIGAEEVHPLLFRAESVARLAGFPFLPITPTFPWLGPLGAIPLPSKWAIDFGKPLDTSSLGSEASRDELLVARLTDELRREVQEMVDAGLRRRSGIFA